jgi:signal transduction histidine kinase
MFDEDDLKVFSVFASQAALAISNAQLYSSLKARVQELSMLYQAGRELSAAYSLDGAAQALVRIAANIGNRSSAMLMLWENRRGARIQASHGVTSALCKAVESAANEEAIAWMRTLREPRRWLLSNAGRRPPAVNGVAAALARSFGWVNVVPMVAEDAVEGVLILGAKDGRPLDQRSARLLQTVSSQAAVVISNARSLDEMRRMSELAAIGQLAANIAHEIRNPLSSIKGAAQFLRDEDTGSLSGREFLDIIVDEVNVLNGITAEFLDYARPTRLDIGRADINKIVSRSLQLMQFDVEGHGIEVRQDLAPGLPSIMADGSKLDQVLRNLITNARQAMPSGGRLTVSTQSDWQGVTVSVEDTGVGIPEHQISQIFQPFFTTKTKGIGIGLAIVQKIIDKHNGRIAVESTPGQGAKFHIYLPKRHVRAGDGPILARGESSPVEVDLFQRAQGSG